MLKIIIIAVIVLAVAALAAWTLILKARKEVIDKLAVSLEAKAEVLDKRQKAIDADQQTLIERYREIAPWVNAEARLFTVTYTVTESDLVKYNSDQAIRNIAKNRMGIVLANDIVKEFPDPAERLGDGGRKVFEYKLKVIEGW